MGAQTLKQQNSSRSAYTCSSGSSSAALPVPREPKAPAQWGAPAERVELPPKEPTAPAPNTPATTGLPRAVRALTTCKWEKCMLIWTKIICMRKENFKASSSVKFPPESHFPYSYGLLEWVYNEDTWRSHKKKWNIFQTASRKQHFAHSRIRKS